jgi:hypothetical protein
MKKPMFTIFLIIVFLAGIYVYSTNGLDNILKKKEGLNTISSSCPNLLIKKDNILLLYNTQKPEQDGVNPIPFYSLDEYIHYLELERKKGLQCPILFLQNEVNTQGEEVYRIRPNPFDMEGGVPQSNTIYPGSNQVIQELDANRANPPYNAGNYPGFDPNGLFIGRYTNIDVIHDSTEKSPISDNPMDSNWGGVIHTQTAVDSGKYDDNRVEKPVLITPKSTQFLPGLFGHPLPKDKLE